MRWLIAALYNATTRGGHRIGAVRFLLRLFANVLIYPLSLCRPVSRRVGGDGAEEVVVSLTSFPARIGQVWRTVVPLLHQRTDVAYRVVLWLSKEQFPCWEDVPGRLRRMVGRGFEIRLREDDLRSHKKYFYAFGEQRDGVVVTVDDDVMYSLDLLPTLLEAHRRWPGAVCCCRGRLMARGADGRVPSYRDWKILAAAELDSVRPEILPTGIGGVLYPAGACAPEVFDVDAFKRTCLCGDDLWLNLMCRIGGCKVVHVANEFRYNTLFFSQRSSLSKSNVKRNENDRQIALLSEWAQERFGFDFFYGTGL